MKQKGGHILRGAVQVARRFSKQGLFDDLSSCELDDTKTT